MGTHRFRFMEVARRNNHEVMMDLENWVKHCNNSVNGEVDKIGNNGMITMPDTRKGLLL